MRVSVLFLLVVGCGAASTSTSTSTSTSASTSASTSTTDTETIADPDAPCTVWDEAHPLEAPADVAAPPETARRGHDGLRFCILREGTGDTRPERTDRVRVHYTGWTTDGNRFDSSVERGEPAVFAVSEVIRGWTDSLTHMTVGQVRRVWIPEALAYQGRAGMPAGMLVFDIELIAIE